MQSSSRFSVLDAWSAKPQRRIVIIVSVVFAFALFFNAVSIDRAEAHSSRLLGILPSTRHGNGKHNDGDSSHTMAADPEKEDGQKKLQHAPTSNDECANFPDTSSVLVLMKTGGSESYARLPTHLLTSLKCLRNHFLLYSDMEEEIGGQKVYDSLETVLDSVRFTNSDFDIYHRQRNCVVAHSLCNKDYNVASEGWNLDKYKNSHIAERAYNMYPNYDWYLIIDADTYVSYPTLMEWLKSMDPKKMHYAGHVKRSGTFPFCHGGSGYVMSQALMKSLFQNGNKLANKYDESVQHHCCGDIKWSDIVLKERGLEPENMWPAFNEQKPNSFGYSEDEWCQPVITLHHVLAEEISDLFKLEKEQKFSKRILIKDLYYKFVASHLQDFLSDWDNASDDVYYFDNTTREYSADELWRLKNEGLSDEESKAHKSLDDCKAACVAQENCKQYRYQNGICGIHYRITHGKPVKKSDDESKRAFSGWMMDRIKKWIQDHGNCDKPYEWRVKDW